ncbi:unnamed protein product, partial [Allacma fusca]
RNASCPSNYFRCCNHLCIPSESKCDGFNDCGDMSDERECPSESSEAKECTELEVMCPKLPVTFTAIAPKFIYPYSTYRVSISVQADADVLTKYQFDANVHSSWPIFNKDEGLYLQGGESGELKLNPMTLTKEVYIFLRVKDLISTETFYFKKYILRGRNGRILMHTDKPIYSPGEDVHLRVNFLDMYDVSNGASAKIKIFDARNHLVKLWEDSIPPDGTLFKIFPLAKILNAGHWNISVNAIYYKDEENREEFSNDALTFEVSKRDPPPFSLAITVPDYIVKSPSAKLPVGIHVVREDDLSIQGDCIVALTVIDDNCETSLSQTIDVFNFKMNVTSMEQLIDGSILTENHWNGPRLEVRVTITDELSGQTVVQVSTVKISRAECKIQTFGMNNFKRPGLPFFISFKIVDMQNEPLKTANCGTIGFKHNFDAEGSSCLGNLMDGAVDIILNSEHLRKDLYISASYAGCSITYDVPVVQSSIGKFVQIRLVQPVTFDQEIVPGTDLKIHVVTTDPVKSVTIAFLCENKVVLTNSFNLPALKTDFEIDQTYPLKIDRYVKLLVFTYIDGIFVSDSLNFKTTSISVTSSEEPLLVASNQEPGRINLSVKAPISSSVYIFGAEKSSLVGREDFLTDNWIQRVLDKTKQNCTYDELKGFEELKRSGMTVLTNAPKQLTTHRGEICIHNYTYNCGNVSTKFPSSFSGMTWISESFIAQSAETNLSISVPSKIENWIFKGYYTHAVDEILRIASFPPLMLNMNSQVSISINLPFSVVLFEELTFPVLIHLHNLSGTGAQNVALTIKNLEDFDAQTSELEKVVQCSEMVTKSTLKVKPIRIGPITIEVVAKYGSKEASVQKQLHILPAGDKRVKRKSSAFLPFSSSEISPPTLRALIVGMGNPPYLTSFNRTNKILTDLESAEVSVCFDVMAFVINNVEELVSLPEISAEVNMLKFVGNVVILKYLTATGQVETEHWKKTVASLERCYQSQLFFRHDDGSFSELGEKTSPGSTWFTAYVVRHLLLARRYIGVDDKILRDGLNFLKNQQVPETGEFKEAVKRGTPKSKIALTAFVSLAFLENQKLNLSENVFGQNIERARNFVKSRSTDLKRNASFANYYAQVLVTYMEHFWHDLNPNEPTCKSRYISQLFKIPKISPQFLTGTPEQHVEILAYIVLTNSLRGKHLVSMLFMNKLLYKGLNEHGGFVGTQDTAVALLAMAEFAEKQRKIPASSQVTISSTDDGLTYTNIATNVTINQSLILHKYPAPVNTLAVKVSSTGTGLVFAQFSKTFFVKRRPVNGSFALDITLDQSERGKFSLRICTTFRREGSSDPTILEVHLPSGYKFYQAFTSGSLLQMSSYRKHQFVNFNTKLEIHMEGLSNNQSSCFNTQAAKAFNVKIIPASYIRAYEMETVLLKIVD